MDASFADIAYLLIQSTTSIFLVHAGQIRLFSLSPALITARLVSVSGASKGTALRAGSRRCYVGPFLQHRFAHDGL